MDPGNAPANFSERPSTVAADMDLSSLSAPRIDRREFHKHALAGALALLGLERASGADPAPAGSPLRSLAPGNGFGIISESPLAGGASPAVSTPILGPEIARLWLDTVKDDPALLASALETIAGAPAIGIETADALRHLGHADPRVRRGVANLIGSKREIPVSFSRIEPLLRDRETAVRGAALAALTARTDVPLPEDILKRLESAHHFRSRKGPLVDTEILDLIEARRPAGSLGFLRRHYLRTAKNDANQDVALQVLEARADLVSRLSVSEIVRCAKGLSASSLQDANEIRLGRILAQRLSGRSDSAADKERLERMAMPLLGLLRKIEERYPGHLAAMGSARSERFAHEALRFLEKAREEEIAFSRLTKREEVNLLVALHNQYCFERDEMRRRIRDLVRPTRANLVGIFQSVYDGEFEEFAYELGLGMEEELRDGVLEAKNGFLDGAARLARERETPGFIWCAGHGGTKHFWLSCGAWGDSESDRLDDPRAISYRELAHTLVSAQLGRHPDRPIRLSHLTIVQDACLQHDFVSNFYDELFRYSTERGATVEALPRMVSASQRGLPSWIRGIEPGMGTFLRRALADTREKRASPLERILRADDLLNERMARELKERDKLVVAQDLSIFSSRVWDLDAIVGDITKALSRRGIELPPLPPPKPVPGAAGRTLQIGRSDGRRPGEALA